MDGVEYLDRSVTADGDSEAEVRSRNVKKTEAKIPRAHITLTCL